MPFDQPKEDLNKDIGNSQDRFFEFDNLSAEDADELTSYLIEEGYLETPENTLRP